MKEPQDNPYLHSINNNINTTISITLLLSFIIKYIIIQAKVYNAILILGLPIPSYRYIIVLHTIYKYK